ncbi:hypothetical protein J2S05_002320 [Alkalicoccobacillus murimartini]|uniref:Uncharacterized protein n=1 Tax=Alkalicoccobacillus murimartini TaxID=171685 RepID=A0ABT9YIK3_9BACI|nr:hypothetical protein [Alkalicoccobacillus murimartini]
MRKLSWILAIAIIISVSGPIATTGGSKVVSTQGQANTGR